MTERVVSALRVLRLIGARVDPTAPLAVGTVARALGAELSAASRLCAALATTGLIERSTGYGAYTLGPRGMRLSGAAAAPYALTTRFALMRAAQETAETIFLAVAESTSEARLVAAIESGWTLHAPATVGEVVTGPDSPIIRALSRHFSEEVVPDELGLARGEVGRVVELAVPVNDPHGNVVAAVGARVPFHRAQRCIPRARTALAAAARALERRFADWLDAPHPVVQPNVSDSLGTLDAALLILEVLAAGPLSLPGIARGTGLRVERAQRLTAACARSGLVAYSEETRTFRLDWSLHGWYRAATWPTLQNRGGPLVAAAAREVRACVFITVLKGMRSFTLVEELEPLGEGLRMASWLSRPHPIVGSDGGPTLAMDYNRQQLAALFPTRHSPQEFQAFAENASRVMKRGVLTMQSIDDVGYGLTSVSAPIRDADGLVAAAVCVVGTTADIRSRGEQVEAVTTRLAEAISDFLAFPHPAHQAPGA